MNENLDQLEAHDGEHFDHWLARIRAAVLPLGVDTAEREA